MASLLAPRAMNSATAQHPLVTQLEAEVLPVPRDALPLLTTEVPSANWSVFACPVGSATSYSGFHVGISCLLPSVPESMPDEVSLIVSVCGLHEKPRLNAEVTWGNGSVETEHSHGATSSEQWPFATSDQFTKTGAELPALIEILGQAAQRGRP